MSLDVYINEQLLELNNNKGIGLTFQIGSILNPGNRAGNLSNKFKVPKTRRNSEILENLSNINSSSNIPYQRNTGKIVQDGIEIFPDGFAVVDSTGKDYNITIYSGNVSFFDLIKGKNINEIDFSDLCHDWTVANVLASFPNNDGYIYPIVDWGDGVALLNNTTVDNNSNALIPNLFLKEVLTRIAANVGYEIKGAFPDSDQWERLLLSPPQFGYLQEERDRNTGVSNDVITVPLTDVTVGSVCSFYPIFPLPFFINIPLVYQTITQAGVNWNQVTGDDFTPDNTYFGNFYLRAFGKFNVPYLPVKGERILQSGTTYNDFKQTLINADYAAWYNREQTANGRRIWIKNLDDISAPILIATDTRNVDPIIALTESSGGYVAYSFDNTLAVEVYIYEIATATITQIYSQPLSFGKASFLKIWNGKVIFRDGKLNGGLFVYDIGTATLKTVKSDGTDIGPKLDSNGDYVLWTEPSSDNIYIWDYATATNTLIENQGAFSGMITPKVLGDYATYFDNILDKMVSYQISTAIRNDIVFSSQIDSSARTPTKLAFSIRFGQLYYYDLVTNTLVTPPTEVSVYADDDNMIDMNEERIVYRYNAGSKEIRTYEISTGLSFTVVTEATQVNFIKIGNCPNQQLVTYRIPALDKLRQYDITSGSPVFFQEVDNIETQFDINKPLFGSNRIIIGADSGLSSSPFDRVTVVEPIANPLEAKIEIVIKEDGIPIYTDNETVTVTSQNNPYNILIQTGVIIVDSGKTYSAHLEITATRDETVNYALQYSLDGSGFSFVAFASIPYGAKLRLENFYNWDQEKPFKDLMNMYSLTVQTDEVSKQIFLTPLDILQDNLSEAINWNDKINLNRPPVVKYKIGKYGQTNYLNYAKDEDVEENLGRGSFQIFDEQLPLFQDIIKLNSCAAASDFRLANEWVPTIPFQTDEGAYYDKKKTRILLLDRITKSSDWKNTRNADIGSATELPLAYFEKAGKNDTLDFPSLIRENYNVLKAIMNQVKFISAGFRLTEVDIANLDFTKPIYLDIHYNEIHINGYFYVNKISNFKKNETTKVDLIRL